MADMRAIIKERLRAYGGEVCHLPSLLPANTVLELAGEELRPRLFFTSDEAGRELCLRPDLTIAAALDFIGSQENEKIYQIDGKVYLSGDTSHNGESYNIGIEKFSSGENENAEIGIFSAVFSALKSAGLDSANIFLADGGLIHKIISGAKIPEVWKNYLLWAHKTPAELLLRLEIARNNRPSKPGALEKSLLTQNDSEAAKTIEEVLNIARLNIGQARDFTDIARRLKSRAERASAEPLNGKIADIIKEILLLEGNPLSILPKTGALGAQIGVDLAQWQNQWQSRIEEISGLDTKGGFKLDFAAARSGRFEYYDGFMFEISAQNSCIAQNSRIAMGGRYDGLIKALSGGKKSAHAIGAVIRPAVLSDILQAQNL